VRIETKPGGPTERHGAVTYKILPAAGFHFLTPWFDLLAGVAGVGRRFKARVVGLAGISDGIRVLDLGCGSGLTVVLVKQRFPRCHVIGVDADPRILGIARRRLQTAQVGGVDFVCARAEGTGLEAACIDVALCVLTFHHLPPLGKEAAAREIGRVLRPGGTLLSIDLRPLIPTRRFLTEQERASPRAGLRTNTPQDLSMALGAAGLQVKDEPSPGGGLFAPWTFALRAWKAR
jgi:ubiquinone/menaquinone biosynthesis C-methylase UbiE